MSLPLAALTAQAQTLTAEGDLAGARDVLSGVLDPAGTDPRSASPDLALAAALQARILVALGDAHAARSWAGFAHAAEERLHGPHDERTIAAAATHAAVLQRVGNHGRAAQLYHDLVGELTASDGPMSARVLAAEADLAIAEHSAGQCTAARARLADAWARHREAHGDASAAGIKMLARLGAMERECGRAEDAAAHLALAQELCARHLSADHSLARQIARLAGSPPSGQHRCGQVRRSTGPATGPATGPFPDRMPATVPGVHPVRPEPAPGDLTGRHARPDAPPAVPPPATSPPAAPLSAASPPGASSAAASPGASSSVAPPAAWPGHVPRQEGRASAASSTEATDATGDIPGVVALPADPRPFRRPVDRASAPVPGAPVEERDLPAGRQPFVLATVLVAGVAAAAAIVAVTLPRGDRAGTSAPPPASAAATGPATAPASGAGGPSGASGPGTASAAVSGPPAAVDPLAPIDVKLRDNRDSVSLTWRYPPGSEGPVLISGGRRGQEQRAFQQLPAGTTDYVVYGLNEQNDYCFTVAVVYTVDKVAASPAVCTARR
ncbi:fibronectin type III domain-containing protein [Couchioplanes azureus]|uniref:fibronectin type III domain-containing protein n=1 Tax=Couchioplanes caeruleus TaxID=56438 RepID=UPI001993B798|nr:hypothetical protein GCM10010166_25520 [Couchioplanes caeruleus subsp. azureus]